jgi:hypothetical protein
VGSRRDYTWILRLARFRVVAMNSETEGGRLMIRVERRGVRRYACSSCGRRTGRVWSVRDSAEPIEFAEAKGRVTRRLRQQIGVD